MDEDRAKRALEAQLFNLLTDREKRNFISIAQLQKKDLFEIFNEIKQSNFELKG